MRTLILALFVGTFSALTVPSAMAVTLLTVMDDKGSMIAEFDQDYLDRMPQSVVRTVTPWTEGVVTFRGVLVRDLLAEWVQPDDQIRAVALNDYAVSIPFRDFLDYPVILASSQNDKTLTIRSKGPLWVIYPWTDHSEIDNETYHSRSIWQLKTIVIEPSS